MSDTSILLHKEITNSILNVFYKAVYAELGYGFLEKVYENALVTELKAVAQLGQEHESQLLNYLRATPYEVGLLLNFGPKPEVRRKVYENCRKSITWQAKQCSTLANES